MKEAFAQFRTQKMTFMVKTFIFRALMLNLSMNHSTGCIESVPGFIMV